MKLIKKKQKKKFYQFFSSKDFQYGVAAGLGAVGALAIQGLVRTVSGLRGDVLATTDDLAQHEDVTMDSPAEEERA